MLPGRTIGMIFHKPSTRTRVGFEVGIAELGGMALYLPAGDLQLARGRLPRHRTRVVAFRQCPPHSHVRPGGSGHLCGARIDPRRSTGDRSRPPVAGTRRRDDDSRAGRGSRGVRLTYLGDGNNVCHSLMRLRRPVRHALHGRVPQGVRAVGGGRGGRAGRCDRERWQRETHVRPARRIGRCRRPLHRRLDEHAARRRSARNDCSISSASASTANCSPSRVAKRWRCTVSRPMSARRSPRTSCTARVRSCGIRPRIACTPRRRSWRS